MTTELEALPPAVDQLLIDLAEMDIVFDVLKRRIDELEAENEAFKVDLAESNKRHETLAAVLDRNVKLIGVHIDEGRWSMITSAAGMGELLGLCFQKIMDDIGAKNYLEIHLDNAATDSTYCVTLQRKSGITPGQKNIKLEAEIKALKAVTTEVIEELASLRKLHYDVDDVQSHEIEDQDSIDALIAVAREMVKP